MLLYVYRPFTTWQDKRDTPSTSLTIVGRGREKREKKRSAYVRKAERTEYRTQVRTSSFHPGKLDRTISELF